MQFPTELGGRGPYRSLCPDARDGLHGQDVFPEGLLIFYAGIPHIFGM